MTTRTRASHKQDAAARPTTVEQLRDLHTELAGILDAIADLAPHVGRLLDSHQRGVGFLGPEGKMAQAAQHAKDRRDLALRLQAGEPVGRGDSPVPGNLAGLSAHAELAFALRHHATRLVNHLDLVDEAALPGEGVTLVGLVAYLRMLIDQAATTVDDDRTAWKLKLLRPTARDLEHARSEAKAVVDGRGLGHVPFPCPHCGRMTLFLEMGKDDVVGNDVITCGRDPKTGHYETCRCPDPICECKTRPVSYRHSWHRTHGTAPNGWQTLKARLKLTQTAKGTPRP